MSLCKFIKRLRKSQYFRDLFFKIVDYALWLYIMFACLWTICYLVGEIFQKMGGGLMAKYYFTFWYDDGGSWTEVSADGYFKASEVFKLYHPPRKSNLLPCAGVYSEEEFQRTVMSRKGNFGKHCLEHIVLNRFAFKEGNDGADT